MLVHKGVPPYRKGGVVIELEPGEVVVQAEGKSVYVGPEKPVKQEEAPKPRSKKK
jgi:hypothetical protein